MGGVGLGAVVVRGVGARGSRLCLTNMSSKSRQRLEKWFSEVQVTVQFYILSLDWKQPAAPLLIPTFLSGFSCQNRKR